MRVAVVGAVVVAVVVVVGGAGCPSGRLSAGGPPAPKHDGDTGENDNPLGPNGYPLPRTDVTDAFGSDDSLDLGAWNLKNFPCGNASNSTECRADADNTPSLVADIIASLDVDLLAVEEIDSEDAFQEVVDRLPDHTGILSQHTYFDGTYQKVGFIYKTALFQVTDAQLLFQDDNAFPRPPLSAQFAWRGPGEPFDFDAVAVHLKAGEAAADSQRRGESMVAMAGFADDLVTSGTDNVIFMGDFNEVLTDPSGAANFAPFEDASKFNIETEFAADTGAVSFLPGGVVLDHMVTTTAMQNAIGDNNANIRRVDLDIDNYLGRVSDHVPVLLRVATP